MYSPHKLIDFRNRHAAGVTVLECQSNETRIGIRWFWIAIFFSFRIGIVGLTLGMVSFSACTIIGCAS